MVVNTVNLSSWLIVNALIPDALPPSVRAEYGNNFVHWPENSAGPAETTDRLITTLKSLRLTVKSLLDSHFTRQHVQPLIELAKTLRIKGVELLTSAAVDGIAALAARENWKIDFTLKSYKTQLPDLYEAEVSFPSTEFHCCPPLDL